MSPYDLYRQYLDSDIWSQLRNQALERDGYHCSICNNPNNLEVHHLKYPEVLGKEPLSDLMTLCRDCHKKIERYKKDHYARQTMIKWEIPEIELPYFVIEIYLSSSDKEKAEAYIGEIECSLAVIENTMQVLDAKPIMIYATYKETIICKWKSCYMADTKEQIEEAIKKYSFSEKPEGIIFQTNDYKHVNFDEYI